MFCSLTHRMISRAEDRGKALPRWAERHLARCGACREYLRFAASLRTRLAAEKPAFLASVRDFPLNVTEPAAAEAGRRQRLPIRSRLVLRPLPAAAAALVVVAGALVLFQVFRRESLPSPQDRAAALATLRSLTAAPDNFRGIVSKAETSLAEERQILEKSFVAAVDYFQARLNIKIERRDPPAKSS